MQSPISPILVPLTRFYALLYVNFFYEIRVLSKSLCGSGNKYKYLGTSYYDIAGSFDTALGYTTRVNTCIISR
jgi:hypothetical protein